MILHFRERRHACNTLRFTIERHIPRAFGKGGLQTTSVDLRIWGWRKLSRDKKRHTAGLLCIIVTCTLFFLDFPFQQKLSCSSGVWLCCVCVSLFPWYSHGSWLSRRTGLVGSGNRFFSLEQHHKSILSSFILLLLFLREEAEDSLHEWTEKYEDDWCFFFPREERHQIHAATTDDEWTHLDRSMRWS